MHEFPQISLTLVTKEAGFPTPMVIKTEGLPNNACLLWIVFGHCKKRNCKGQHITSISDEVAANLY